MASIPTSIWSGLTQIASGVGSAIQGLAPLAAPIAAAALPLLLTPKQRVSYGNAAMPGGAPLYGNGYGSSPLALMPGGPMLQPAGIFGGAEVPSTGGQYSLYEDVVRGPQRLPRTVEGKDAKGRTRVYVLAPMVKYRVSISRAGRRRCSGGR